MTFSDLSKKDSLVTHYDKELHQMDVETMKE